MGTGEAGQRVGDKVTGAVLEVPGHTPHSFRPRSGGGTGRPPDANSMVRVTMRKRQLAERIGRVVGTAARPGRRASVERTGTGRRFRAGSGPGRAGRLGRSTRAGEPEDPSRPVAAGSADAGRAWVVVRRLRAVSALVVSEAAGSRLLRGAARRLTCRTLSGAVGRQAATGRDSP
ncbi:hypothetical protein GCM10010392_63500 [Streptomyces clavifer]|nr:hypothetical protein GCM10010392_63500 [Streptomyces clavifer]